MSLRDDKLWDELRYWLKNPLTEHEQSFREKQENAYINRVLNKAFGIKDDGVMTGGASPVELNAVKYKNPYEEIQNNPNLSKDEKVTQIKAITDARNKEIDDEHRKKMIQYGAGAGIQMIGSAIPGAGAIGAKAAGAVAKKLAPTVGRKIASITADNLVRGGLAGAVEGFGRGMLNNENPLKTSAQDAVAGATIGGALGAGGGNIQKAVKGKNLKNYGNVDELDKSMRKQYFKDSRTYYKDYVQGHKLDRFGNVEFSNRGIQEQLRWNPQQAQNFPKLIDDIKHAKRLPNEPNKDALDKTDTQYFEVYRGKNGDHYIERLDSGKRRFYITKSTPATGDHTASMGSSKNASNSIIQDPAPKFKSDEDWLEWFKQNRGHK